MESDKDSFNEEDSDNEQEVAGPLNIQVEVHIEEFPESPPRKSPELVLPRPIPLGKLAQVWELPDDGTNFLNFYTRSDIVELKEWAKVSRERRNEEGYFIEEPMVSQSLEGFLRQNYGPQWEGKLLQPSVDVIFWKIIGIYCGICQTNGLESAAAETTIWKLVSRKNIPAEIVGGVGWLSRITVSRSALPVVGGLLALGGLCIVVYCAAFFFGIAQQLKIFLAFLR